jgi:hypothetical protein
VPTAEPGLGLLQGLGADNARDYLKTHLAASLAVLGKGVPEAGNASAYADLQDAIDAAPSGGVVDLPADMSTLVTIVVDKPLTVRGHGHSVTMLSIGVLFDVQSSDVTFEGLELVGPRGPTAVASVNERAIQAIGASADVPLTNIRVLDCHLRDWGDYGVYLKWVEDFRIRHCTISNIWYAGVGGTSVQRGWITDNDVHDINGTPNAYGVFLSREESSSLATDPRSGNVQVARNIVRNVTHWEGLDTHGGVSIHFVDNQVIGCKIGISVGPADNGSNVEAYAPFYCTVVGNTIDSGVTDGSAAAGINIAGVTGGEKALALRVAHNTVVGHGAEGSTTNGGIIARDTRGLQLIGNNPINCSPHGIVLVDANDGVVLSGGTIVDPWSNTNSIAVGVYVQGGNETGVLGGFSVVDGPLTGKTHIHDGGAVRVAADATNVIELLPFHTNVTPRTALSATATESIRTEVASRAGFFGATPVVQPASAAQAAAPAGGTGAAAGGWDTAGNRDTAIATINAMRTALVNLGLIKGSA